MDTNLKCVYRHRRVDNNEIFYVGMGNCKRPYTETKRSTFWKKIKNKANGFIVEILAENLSLEDAYDLEKLLISEYGRRDNNTGILVNHTDGGDGSLNTVTSDATRLKQSIARKGIKKSDEHKRKITESLKKAIRTPEVMEKLRNGSTIFKKGQIISQEIKNKMSLNSARKKTVMCIVSNKKWDTIKNCAEDNGLNEITLGQRLNGRMHNNTTFKYLTDAN